MLHETNIRKGAVIAALVLHIGWIGNHMRLVANDQINPWRLGGYAMYTVPNPGSNVQVYDVESATRLSVRLLQYEVATRSTNVGRTFRCAGVPGEALRRFFGENQDLIGRNIRFVYSERRFTRSPPSTKIETQGTVSVAWQGDWRFTYTNSFCGKEETASATM